MGRDRSSYWAARRRAHSRPAAPVFQKRVYDFADRLIIGGVEGPACVEALAAPLKTAPDATMRVMVRWEGKLAKGAVVELLGGKRLTVVRMFPMSTRVRVAHLLCKLATDAQGATCPT